MDKLKNYFSKQYKWYSLNVEKIFFVVGLHFILLYIVNLPYVNIFTSLFAFLPYLFDWIAILILFKPNKELILKIGIVLFFVGFIFALVKLSYPLEILGQISFFLIGTYIILVAKEVKED